MSTRPTAMFRRLARKSSVVALALSVSAQPLLAQTVFKFRVPLRAASTAEPQVPGQLQFDPSLLEFSALQQGQQSSVQTQLRNTVLTPGATVALQPLELQGPGYSQINDCTASLAPGAHCTVTVQFTPGAVGPYPGTLTARGDAGSLQTTASLTGQSVPGTLGYSASSVSFLPALQVGTAAATQTVTVTNTGSAPVSNIQVELVNDHAENDFSSSDNCPASLTSSQNCVVTLGFTPRADGPRSASLTVTSNAQTPSQTIVLGGAGASPAAQLTALGHGDVASGSFRIADATLTNQGIGVLSLTVPDAASVSGTGFSFASTDCGTTLAVGASCLVRVLFTASGARDATGTLSVTAGGVVRTAGLTARSTLAALSLSNTATLAFGSLQTGQTRDSAAITLTNTGNVTATGLTITPPAGYTVPSRTCATTLAAGSTCTFTVRFAPTAAQAYNNALSVTAAQPSTGASANLTGTGTSPSYTKSQFTASIVQYQPSQGLCIVGVRNNTGQALSLTWVTGNVNDFSYQTTTALGTAGNTRQLSSLSAPYALANGESIFRTGYDYNMGGECFYPSFTLSNGQSFSFP